MNLFSKPGNQRYHGGGGGGVLGAEYGTVGMCHSCSEPKGYSNSVTNPTGTAGRGYMQLNYLLSM